MANKVEYQIVGRYMSGTEVTGYHLQSILSGKSNRYSKEQVIFLVGKGQVTNCTGQLYQDKVLLRGTTVSLEKLPVKTENGEIKARGTSILQHRGQTAEQAMNQLELIKRVIDGRNTVAYIAKNFGGKELKLGYNRVLELASKGQISNARTQMYGGKLILKGVNSNLNSLQVISVCAGNECKEAEELLVIRDKLAKIINDNIPGLDKVALIKDDILKVVRVDRLISHLDTNGKEIIMCTIKVKNEKVRLSIILKTGKVVAVCSNASTGKKEISDIVDVDAIKNVENIPKISDNIIRLILSVIM